MPQAGEEAKQVEMALLLQLEEARKETRFIQQQVSEIRNPTPDTRNPKPEVFRLYTCRLTRSVRSRYV